MAQGDVTWFGQAKVDLGESLHDLENDVIKIFLTDGSTVLAATTADCRYGAGGTTNLSSEECAAGGNYSAGGATPAAPSVTLNSSTAEIDWGDVSWSKHASNPTDATYAVAYNDTDAGKRCLCYIDLGGAYNMTTGDLAITMGAPFTNLT
jgi:hypothetical protein